MERLRKKMKDDPSKLLCALPNYQCLSSTREAKGKKQKIPGKKQSLRRIRLRHCDIVSTSPSIKRYNTDLFWRSFDRNAISRMKLTGSKLIPGGSYFLRASVSCHTVYSTAQTDSI